MVREIPRRDVLKTTGVASTVGLSGFAGCLGGNGDGDGDGGDGGDGGSGSPPDMLTVIGYPEDGIQLFRDLYSSFSDVEVLIPDGLRDPDLPGQVGNDMSTVTGTAPAAGGPNQEAFNSLFEDEYGESPGVFTSQSYDSAAIGILANAAAGENSGTAIRMKMNAAPQMAPSRSSCTQTMPLIGRPVPVFTFMGENPVRSSSG